MRKLGLAAEKPQPPAVALNKPGVVTPPTLLVPPRGGAAGRVPIDAVFRSGARREPVGARAGRRSDEVRATSLRRAAVRKLLPRGCATPPSRTQRRALRRSRHVF